MMLRSVILMGGFALLAACAASPEMPAPDGMADTCGAAESQSLIGRNVAAVSFASDANVRVACTTCAVTMDYNPGRMNVFFDQDAGVIERVTCG
ncbi:MAG: I78 family peptidase inhibitor [Brevundimonas sp.]|uniref:I78 family peptidase inhibitor n=1 Tax=Brevundimonas sp. TaxID=1871086 RepID=UPI00276F8CD1|nr:I78 family peptidase inhibitor [Brevundimonas sp.]MDP3401199.1 I78 family peptidase inhibitor [Brevundimonas sp.]MDZ4114296.1 I78 family peptidase inhibitor [Brevundimonas sp.]